VNISIFHHLPIQIRFGILKEGKLVFCKDKNLLNAIKAQTFGSYLDFSFFTNQIYRKAIENI